MREREKDLEEWRRWSGIWRSEQNKGRDIEKVGTMVENMGVEKVEGDGMEVNRIYWNYNLRYKKLLKENFGKYEYDEWNILGCTAVNKYIGCEMTVAMGSTAHSNRS